MRSNGNLQFGKETDRQSCQIAIKQNCNSIIGKFEYNKLKIFILRICLIYGPYDMDSNILSSKASGLDYWEFTFRIYLNL